ncbi:hypothetical protein [Streptomyces tubercidicus]|uniref:hypothetical protein n=1 Tax=Streptomyces tubercidicus TaxID=47759 RepID=UPI00135B1562|nr:hypothetical protein [Streptomyces tubercidicus]WAU15332.1 hypothetical protein STRTU_006034 [Streptomyces tubercidicus]
MKKVHLVGLGAVQGSAFSARSQHRSSATPPNGPEGAAAEVSTNSARSGSGSFEANETKPLTCMFVIVLGV